MLGWLQALFLDGKARESLSRAKAASRAGIPATRPAVAASADRVKLLREAAEIHRAKRKILDALSDEDRAKLVSMAILTFLNQGAEPPPDPKTRK